MHLSRYLIALLFVTSLPTGAFAWNLICGVSIGAASLLPNNENKWNADSYALRGIGEFYMAVAELQRLDLGAAGSFKDPNAIDGKTTAVDAATAAFERSHAEFVKALEIATKEGLGDDNGLTALTKLRDGTLSLVDTIKKSKTLPELGAVQELALTINNFTSHGVELSQKHLKEGLAGHGQGGNSFNIK